MSVTRLVQLAGPMGLYSVARRLTRNHPRILMYHRFSGEPQPGHVSAARFEEQVRYIARHHHPMALGELITHLREVRPVPAHTLVITVDDGYADFHDVAWPILKKHGVPATLFVTTGFVDRELWLWPDQVAWLLEQAPEIPEQLQLRDASIPTAGNAWQSLINHLLTLPDQAKHEMIQRLAEQLQTTLPSEAPAAYASCTWDQLRRMQDEGLEVGGHTHTHPTLPKVEHENLPGEIHFCRERLQAELGDQPRPFCYPNGQPADFSMPVRNAVEGAGFTGAVVAYADETPHGDLYALRRHSSSANMFQFYKACSGLEWAGMRLRSKRDAA
ncbi:MAG: polysaccharide deacetylase family protein [Ectothiorhodospiraceae bacterium]|nr:polysaccharide deacetylase family protein [Ectothiorhodospiraceae bacterium]